MCASYLSPPRKKRKPTFLSALPLTTYSWPSTRQAVSFQPLIPRVVRERAIKKAENWFIERLNGTDGLGAIFPAMINAHEALLAWDIPRITPIGWRQGKHSRNYWSSQKIQPIASHAFLQSGTPL